MGSSKSGCYHGINLENLNLIGEGHQGKVYMLSKDRVLKVFKTKHALEDQLLILRRASNSRFFPIVYDYDKYSIVMDFISGQPLDRYLASNKITEKISFELVEVINEFKSLGFTRLDIRLPHIFLQGDESIKIIDPRKSFEIIQQYPRLMLKGLQENAVLQDFFNFIRSQYGDTYLSWSKQWKSSK
jgi:predicted Ser/Thr protein kinase